MASTVFVGNVSSLVLTGSAGAERKNVSQHCRSDSICCWHPTLRPARRAPAGPLQVLSFKGNRIFQRRSIQSSFLSDLSKGGSPTLHRGRGALHVVAERNAGISQDLPAALLFDCDGVLVDTERDGHRIAFNETFKEKGLQEDWDVETYGRLLEIGGGKERMTHHFNEVGWPFQIPSDEQGRKDFIAGMHKRKTEIFMSMVESGRMPLRPGVARLVDEAFSAGVPVAVCSTSNEKAVSAIVRVMLGDERAAKIRIFAGDMVPKKKPDPAIYNLAADELKVDASKCVVVEDSFIGLSAAKAAGMTCVVTKSVYTGSEDFSAADAVFESIGDAPKENFGLQDLAKLSSQK